MSVALSKIERAVAETCKAQGLALRFDKVALRVIANLKDALSKSVPEDQTLVFTITAPIRLPSKTVAAIEDLLRDGLPSSDVQHAIHGNLVRLFRVTGTGIEMSRIIDFVHNPGADAGIILKLAMAQLIRRK